jgi:glucokinase
MADASSPRPSGGRPAPIQQAATERDAPWLLGLDVGGTKIAAGVLDESGTVLIRRVEPTRADRGGEAVLADALALAEELAAEADALGGRIAAVGVGVAELVDPSGEVRSSHALAWQGLPVRERFGRIAPALVESDVRAAALAEARYGAGRPFRLFAYVTVGTGISSCLVQDGRPSTGARGNALVLASSPLSSTCHRCGARTEQVLEEFAAGPALAARYRRRSGRPAARAEDVLAAAAAGDVAAVEVVRSAGEALGNSVGFLVNVLDPEAVVVGGGLGLAGGLYWDSFVAATREHVWSEETRELPILPAALGPDSGFVGAARAAWERCGQAAVR